MEAQGERGGGAGLAAAEDDAGGGGTACGLRQAQPSGARDRAARRGAIEIERHHGEAAGGEDELGALQREPRRRRAHPEDALEHRAGARQAGRIERVGQVDQRRHRAGARRRRQQRVQHRRAAARRAADDLAQMAARQAAVEQRVERRDADRQPAHRVDRRRAEAHRPRQIQSGEAFPYSEGHGMSFRLIFASRQQANFTHG